MKSLPYKGAFIFAKKCIGGRLWVILYFFLWYPYGGPKTQLNPAKTRQAAIFLVLYIQRHKKTLAIIEFLTILIFTTPKIEEATAKICIVQNANIFLVIYSYYLSYFWYWLGVTLAFLWHQLCFTLAFLWHQTGHISSQHIMLSDPSYFVYLILERSL